MIIRNNYLVRDRESNKFERYVIAIHLSVQIVYDFQHFHVAEGSISLELAVMPTIISDPESIAQLNAFQRK